MTRQPFQRHRQVKDFSGRWIFFITSLEFLAHCQGVFQRDVQHRRHQFGDPVHFAERYVQRPADIPYRGAGSHRPERDDLRHMVDPIAGGHILDDFAAPDIAKVDVDIRHGHAFRIQEPLKQQPVLQRINIGDFQQIRHDAPRSRSPARAHRNPRLSGILYKIPDDQKIAGKAHTLDHGQFIIQPLPFQRPGSGITRRQCLLTEFPQVGIRRNAGRQRKIRQMQVPELKIDLAALRDPAGIRQRFGIFGKQRRHFPAGFQIEFRGRKTHASRIFNALARLYAEQYIMGVGVGPVDIMNIVGGDQPDAQLARQLD